MKYLILLLLFVPSFILKAQNTGNNSPNYYFKGALSIGKGNTTYANASSYLEVGNDTSSRGILFPRISLTSDIVYPVEGLFVYNKTLHALQFYNGSIWSLGGANLQGTTALGNTTDRSLQITSTTNLNSSLESTYIAYDPNSSAIFGGIFNGGVNISALSIGPSLTQLNTGNLVFETNSSIPKFSFKNTSNILIPIDIGDASTGTQAVTLNQVNAIVLPDIHSSTSTLTLVRGYYTFEGTTSIWTLPPVVGNTGKTLILINTGSGTITVNSNAGGNDIFNAGISLNTFNILTGINSTLYNNGTKWVVLNN